MDASCCLHVASCTALVCFLLHPCAQATVYHGFIINFYYYVHSFTGGVGKENMRAHLREARKQGQRGKDKKIDGNKERQR